MFGRLLLLFLVVPLIDATLLVTIGARIGFWPTLGLVVASALVGSWLARREGLAAWRRVQERLATGAMPGPELIDGLVVLMSATLLVAPGFITDAVGLLGLFPPTRALARRALVRRFERGIASGAVRVTAFGAGPSPFGQPPFGQAPFPHTPLDAPSAGIEDAEVIDDGRPS